MTGLTQKVETTIARFQTAWQVNFSNLPIFPAFLPSPVFPDRGETPAPAKVMAQAEFRMSGIFQDVRPPSGYQPQTLQQLPRQRQLPHLRQQQAVMLLQVDLFG